MYFFYELKVSYNIANLGNYKTETVTVYGVAATSSDSVSGCLLTKVYLDNGMYIIL